METTQTTDRVRTVMLVLDEALRLYAKGDRAMRILRVGKPNGCHCLDCKQPLYRGQKVAEFVQFWNFGHGRRLAYICAPCALEKVLSR